MRRTDQRAAETACRTCRRPTCSALPADIEAQSAVIGARRIRLPEERAELVRARLGQRGCFAVWQRRNFASAAEELSGGIEEKDIANASASGV